MSVTFVLRYRPICPYFFAYFRCYDVWKYFLGFNCVAYVVTTLLTFEHLLGSETPFILSSVHYDEECPRADSWNRQVC